MYFFPPRACVLWERLPRGPPDPILCSMWMFLLSLFLQLNCTQTALVLSQLFDVFDGVGGLDFQGDNSLAGESISEFFVLRSLFFVRIIIY